MRLVRLALVIASAALGVAGCGGDEPDGPVDAQEANVVAIDGLRYRVVLFRQLNPNIEPDDALYEGPPAPSRSGLFAAFVRVCNDGSDPRTATESVHLEDAFGERFAPQPDRVPDRFGYRAVELDPGECLPARSSSAEQTYDGAALVFEVPFASVRERPLILELQGDALSDPERILLDL